MYKVVIDGCQENFEKYFLMDQERVRRRAATEGRPYSTVRSLRFPNDLGANCRGGPPWPPGIELNSLRNNPGGGGSLVSLSSTPDL